VTTIPPTPDTDVVVVGAGLAGLAAARRLQRSGFDVVVLDGADAVGGRVRTDEVDGFLLDRGFQILLTAYPELEWALDLDALDLRAFLPGALVWRRGRFHRLGDPLRRPRDLPASARARVGTPLDKLRVLRFRRSVRLGTVDALLARPDTTAEQRLRWAGFSDGMIDAFFRPLFGGIALDPTLAFSSRTLEFVFRMLAEGDAAVPAGGMARVPDQIAAGLAPGTVRLGEPVAAVDTTAVQLAGGARLGARAVIVATGADEATRLTGAPDPGWRGVTTVWFAADAAPVAEPLIVLDGDRRGPVVDLAVLSAVSPRYAPPGRHLVAASIPGTPPGVEAEGRAQLREWFGAEVDGWATLRVDAIAHAQPARPPGYPVDPPAVLDSGVVVAGDHRATASIDGALASGRRAAHAVISRLADRR